MPNQRIKLCDACHKREATCHVSSIVDGKIHSSDLCGDCFEEREPVELKQSRRAAEAAHCEYCGGRPCVDWNSITSVFGVIVGQGQTRCLCECCSTEYNRFLAQEMERVPPNSKESEVLAKLTALREHAHAHMLAWVAKKSS